MAAVALTSLSSTGPTLCAQQGDRQEFLGLRNKRRKPALKRYSIGPRLVYQLSPSLPCPVLLSRMASSNWQVWTFVGLVLLLDSGPNLFTEVCMLEVCQIWIQQRIKKVAQPDPQVYIL